MKEKKKSAVSWILTWAGQKRSAYVWSVLLAIGNVIFKILPYFIIADVVKLFLNGEKEFEKYLIKVVLIALSFVIAELFHSLSTSLSHKATFVVLANIRKACSGSHSTRIYLQSACTGCNPDLFLPDRLSAGTLVFSSDCCWTFLIFWNDAGL